MVCAVPARCISLAGRFITEAINYFAAFFQTQLLAGDAVFIICARQILERLGQFRIFLLQGLLLLLQVIDFAVQHPPLRKLAVLNKQQAHKAKAQKRERGLSG